jgi:hypothetical protein
MALFQQSLDRCLDNTVSAPANRRTKRARDDEESAVEQRGLEETGLRTTRKKRVKRDTSGRKYACPFSKHDPGKYKNVKTCCGPGWDDVHRVKQVALLCLSVLGLASNFLTGSTCTEATR